jgi:hypothetical protein
MKLVIVGPGIMSIPPVGWGAVESLIWDYKIFLDKYHPDIQTVIVNEKNQNAMINKINAENPDVVHIQYDNHAPIVRFLNCKNVLITSHYGYLDQLYTRNDRYYAPVHDALVKSSAALATLSPSIANIYRKSGVPENRIYVQHNGANDEVFRYTDSPLYPDRSIYLAKIDARKRQHVYQDMPSLYFAGNCVESRFNTASPRYLGEWKKAHLYDNLTDYGNLVLLSDGEAHPLVCCEALVAGLGLVISEFAAANLDTSLPFIDVIPTAKLNDISYVESVIVANRERAVKMRAVIRKYGVETFGWKTVVDRYAALLNRILHN